MSLPQLLRLLPAVAVCHSQLLLEVAASPVDPPDVVLGLVLKLEDVPGVVNVGRAVCVLLLHVPAAAAERDANMALIAECVYRCSAARRLMDKSDLEAH